jgi:TolA-binding protein
MPHFTRHLLVLLPLVALLSGASARADSIRLRSGESGSIDYSGAKIVGIEQGQLLYRTRDGRDNTKELDKVERIDVDGEPALAEAESAFSTDAFDKAVDGYQKVIRSTNKPWLAYWSSRRLQVAAEKTGRFDAAASAYIARVQIEDPNNVPRPALPSEQSTYLNTAAKDVMTAIGNPKLTDPQRIALLSFLVDLQRARRDTKAADDASNRLDELLAKDPNNPNASRAIAKRKLQSAQAAMDKKDFRGAMNEIESSRAQFTDPVQQADALYLLAEARFQLAAASKQTAVQKEGALKDAALAFTRVVAHFRDAPDRPHVTAALMRLAQIEEMLGDAPAARSVYEQLASQYPDDPNAAPARQSADRLRSAPTTSPSAGTR